VKRFTNTSCFNERMRKNTLYSLTPLTLVIAFAISVAYAIDMSIIPASHSERGGYAASQSKQRLADASGSTTNNVPYLQVFEPPDAATVSSVAPNTAIVWSASLRKAPLWRVGNPGIKLFRYHILCCAANPDPSDYASATSYWVSKHPDWVAYSCTGKLPFNSSSAPAGSFGSTNTGTKVSGTVLDPSVPDAATYLKNDILQSSKNVTGVAIDNYVIPNYVGACGHYDTTGGWHWEYNGVYSYRPTSCSNNSCDNAWDRANAALMQSAVALVHSGGSKVMCNGGPTRYDLDDALAKSVLSICDIVLDEGDNVYPSPSVYDFQLQWYQQLQSWELSWAQIVNFPLPSSAPRRSYWPATPAQYDWAVAITLLGKTRIDGYNGALWAGVSNYYGGKVRYNPTMSTDFGPPCANYDYNSASGMFHRNLRNAWVGVNTSPTPQATTFPKFSSELVGQGIDGSSVPPRTAYILLVSAPQC
jgi:hypothetical protein